MVHVLSYDERLGIQATANTSANLQLNGGHKTISRDYEYKSLGTISLLAGIDLQTGEAIPLIKDFHNSKDYIEFTKKPYESIPKQKRYVFKQINREAYRIWSKIMSQ